MAYINTNPEQDDFVMEVLKRIKSPLSRAAVMIMLEDGICTQEVKIREYVYAKNTAQALVEPEEYRDYYLAQNLTQEEYELLSNVFYELLRERETCVEHESF